MQAQVLHGDLQTRLGLPAFNSHDLTVVEGAQPFRWVQETGGCQDKL